MQACAASDPRGTVQLACFFEADLEQLLPGFAPRLQAQPELGMRLIALH